MKFGTQLLVLITFIGLYVSSAMAQVPISIGGLELSTSITSPAPGQNVVITAKSYTVDINSAKISWVVNGSTVKSAVGATTLTVQAPALGKKTTINVSAATTDGRTVTSSITLGSGSVDLIVESDGYVPQSFKGKVSPVYQNVVKVVAVPHLANSNGVEYDPSTLVYQWKKNDRSINDQSGYNRQAVSIEGDLVPRPYTVNVDVSSRDGTARAQGSIEVSFGEPYIKFYIDDPLYGTMFNRTIGNSLSIQSKKETSVRAVPFAFSGPSDTLPYSWTINNSVHQDLSSNQKIILRAPEQSSGVSSVGLDVRNSKKILQHAKNSFSASFNVSQEGTPQQATF